MKIIITGGHLTPALSVIDYALDQKDQVIFVGRALSSPEEKIKSREKLEARKRQVKYEQIDSFKLHRHNKLKSLIKLPKLITSIFQANKIIKTNKPDIFISFGGYLSFPFVLSAKKNKIPVLIHEQTRHMGLANKISSKYANVIAISFKNTHNLPKHKQIIYTGNPIRKEFKQKNKKPKFIKSKKPILYFTGGNQGSQIINETVKRNISKLTKSYCVIHQCGGFGSGRYYKDLTQEKNNLKKTKKINYVVKEWFTAEEVSWLFKNALCLVGRSGANTISEIIYSHTPSILIPLPFSAHNEQLLNAKYISKENAGITIKQNKLTDERLLQSIKKIDKQNKYYKNKLKKLNQHQIKNAQEEIYQIAKNLVDEQNKTKKTSQEVETFSKRS